jgi:histidine triad (HIT) family protein
VANGCIFCSIVAGDAAADRVLDEEGVAAFLDVRPLFKGHVLVVPKAHVETLADLPADGIAPLFSAVQRIGVAVERALSADGSFMAINNKISQSVPHLHVHVIPRTKGDGLKGFFWPRQKYADDGERAAYAAKLRESLLRR